MTADPDRLALEGGTPACAEFAGPPYIGAGLLGEEELVLLREVVEAHAPFREYGQNPPHMVLDLEREARAYLGADYALALTSGTAALCCAMAGLGLGPGDEVVMPALTWYSTFMAPILVGATPVFVDIDESLSLDPEDLERKLTSHSRAVIVVHFQGGVGRLGRIMEVAAEHDLAVVEDCAQAWGASYQGRKAGSIGAVGCFSFQQNKILTSGDGGLLATSDPLVFERAVRFHDLGMIRPGLAAQLPGEPQLGQFSGVQFRMNEFTGAVALAQLRKLEPLILQPLRGYAGFLRETLPRTCPGIKFRAAEDPAGDCAIALFLDLEDPQRAGWFVEALRAEGARAKPATACGNLLHTDLVRQRAQVHPALPPFGPGMPGEGVTYSPDQCPRTDRLLKSMVGLMLFPRMSQAQVEQLAQAVAKVWRWRPWR